MKSVKIHKKKYKRKKEGKKHNYNQEILGVVVLALGILTFLSVYFNNSIGVFGVFIKGVFSGFMGITSYLLPPVIIVYSVFMIFKKNSPQFNLKIMYLIILFVLISAIIQVGYYKEIDYSNKTFIKSIEKLYADGMNLSGGGVLGGMLTLPLMIYFKNLGTIIILTTASIIDVMLLTNISVAGLLKGIKNLFVKKGTSAVKNTTLSQEEERKITVDDLKDYYFETDEIGYTDMLEQKHNTKPKIIDFKIEKDNRSVKSKEKSGRIYNENDIGNAENINNERNNESEKAKIDRKKGEEIFQQEINKSLAKRKTGGLYQYPKIEFLKSAENSKNIRAYKAQALEGAKILEDTLKSFGVDARVINISRGPTVTRYELQPNVGVKVSKIVNLADDIALNLAAPGVRIEAPIPGKAAVGIEVPNKEITPVLLREVIESEEFMNHSSKLAFALGKDISGECIIADISKMPHLLIAGATGSGKSVCINCLIMSLLYKASPEEVKFLMIDPKVVELGIYNGIPHLLIPVVTDPRKAAGALNWAVQEMVNRYKLFAEKSVRDMNGYNDLLRRNGEEGILPNIVIIIDELADLMMVAPNDVEDAICRLAQMARAAGMHLVIATQRPSVDVITGVIKANIPSRISFAVSSQVDSRTILDMGGAEKLLGKGDMLYHPIGKAKPIRLQGAFVSESEVEKTVEFLKEQGKTEYDNDIIEEINKENVPDNNISEKVDEILPKAIELVIETGQASVSLIQRKFKVGYARAGRIIDQMEERGIIGGPDGSKPRQILISKQQWQEMQMFQEK
ncbi:MAG TPA: DNA translocase FtsK [Clostridiaceae bacterium]|nr:DNA translocase FtsK [Clostridiaceae bacterium]